MFQFVRMFLNKFKEYIALVVLLILSLILITLNNNLEVKNIRLFSLGIFASVNSFVTNFPTYFENTTYIENLERRNAELMLQVNELRDYGLENKELNDILKFRSDSSDSLLTAKIISRLVSKVSGYFIISKGSDDGVNVGMPVITDKGLVGIITETAANYSSVRIFENSAFKVAVKVQRSNINGILNWDGKNLIIKNVPTNYDVEVGDRIIVSEISSIIPPEIPIGIIIEKESTISGILSNLKIEPFVKLNSIKNVLVVLTEQQQELDSLRQKIIGGSHN